jgi:hypothetical protein
MSLSFAGIRNAYLYNADDRLPIPIILGKSGMVLGAEGPFWKGRRRAKLH